MVRSIYFVLWAYVIGEFLAIYVQFYAQRLLCEVSLVSWFISRKSPPLSCLHYFVYFPFILNNHRFFCFFLKPCFCNVYGFLLVLHRSEIIEN